MEETNLGRGKHYILLWVGSKRRFFHMALLLSICIWVFLQMASSHNYGSGANSDETSLQGSSSKVMNRKLLSRQWVFEDETNEPWDVVAAGEDGSLVTIKEDGGTVGDDNFDDDEVDEVEEEHSEDDVERTVELDNQATTYHIRAELREVGTTNTFNDVNGIPPGSLYGSSSNMNSSDDVATTTIHPELEEFFEIETI